MVSVLDERSRRVTGWVRGLGAAGVGLLVLLSVAEGLGRVAFDLHFSGMAAVIGASISAYAFLLLADTTAHGRIIRVARFETWLATRSRTAGSTGRAVAEGVTAAVLALTAFACAAGALELWRSSARSSDSAEPAAFIALAFAVIAAGAALTAVLHLRRLIDELAHVFPTTASGVGRARVYAQTALWTVGAAAAIWAGSRLIADHADWTAVTVAGMTIVLLALLAGGLQVAIVMILFFPVVTGLDTDPNVVRVFLLGTEAAIVPVFILLALVYRASGLTTDLAVVVRWTFSRSRSGEGLVALWGNACAGALTSLSDDSATRAVGRDIPAMVGAGFWPRTAVGIVTAGAALGAILPPSLLIALYAMDSHTGAFATAALAGVVLLVAYSCMVASPVSLRGDGFTSPQARDVAASSVAARAVRAFAVPAVVLVAVFSERFTLAEAGALALVTAAAVGIAGRRLELRDLWGLLADTSRLAVPILFLLVAGGVYAWLLTATGIVQFATVTVAPAGAAAIGFAVLVGMVLLLRWLGLGAVSVLMLLFPLWLPLMKVVSGTVAPDVFGVVLLLMVQAAVLIIPGERYVQAVRRALGDQNLATGRIAAAALPFAVTMVAVGALAVAVSWLGWWAS